MRKKLSVFALMFLIILSIVVGLTACETEIEKGRSAYELYKETYIQENGSEEGVLSESEWLLSLKGESGSQGQKGESGENGKSAYDLYIEAYVKEYGSEEGKLSLNDWLLSLKGETGSQGIQGEQGETGEDGKSAYELYVEAYIKATGSGDGVLSEEEWLNSLRGGQGETGEDGKSAYELYVEAYIKATGSGDGVLSEEEWLDSLRGEQGEMGEDGKSAYELYVEAYIKDTGSSDGVLSEEEWLDSLRGEQGETGEDGKSAYELYVEAYIKATGSGDGVLSEEKWLDSLYGEIGIGIDRVEIVCGDVIIYYDNDESDTLENMLPEAGHNWDEGAITTNPTCITPGIITYLCNDCGTPKKSFTDANGEHRWGDYDNNEEYHWRTCKICGEVEKHEHNFGENIIKDNVDVILECECGINQTVGEFFAFKVVFECDAGASVLIYETQDYTVEGSASNVAYSRNGDTGELLNDGTGQINFFVEIPEDYVLDEILIEPSSGYKNFKGKEDTGLDNTFRITKIGHNLTVKISTKAVATLENFGSFTDENGVVTFAWDSTEDIKYVIATVSSQEVISEYKICNMSSWNYNLVENTNFDFKFTPFMKNDVSGKAFECTRYYSSTIKTVAFPRIDIITQNYIFPSCDYVSAPAGCWGNGTTNKNYVQCIVNLYNSNSELIFHSDNNLSQAEAYNGAKIKVRGNSSAYSEKKPYKVKLNKKYDLLSSLLPIRTDKVYEDKEWLLLNSGAYLNQLTGWSVSSTLQMEYTPAYSYVELYMNGDYRGLYILCESVEQGNGFGEEQARCAVSDNGFIVEMDAYWWNEDLYFSTPYTQGKAPQYTFKYPDSDDINTESPEYLYIQGYISDFEKALLKDDDSYLQYIDEESFVRWLMAHDILGTYDSGGSNIFMTKFDNTNQSVLKMGPLWDFDSIRYGGVNNYGRIRYGYHFYYPLLVNKTSFIEKYAEIFNEIKSRIILDFTENVDRINAAAYNTLINYEQLRWKTKCNTFEVQKNNLISWFEQHLAWMSNEVLGVNA